MPCRRNGPAAAAAVPRRAEERRGAEQSREEQSRAERSTTVQCSAAVCPVASDQVFRVSNTHQMSACRSRWFVGSSNIRNRGLRNSACGSSTHGYSEYSPEVPVSTHAVSGPAPAACRALTQRVLLGSHIGMLLGTRRKCPSTHATVRTFAIEMRMRQPPENALVGHVFCSSKNCSGTRVHGAATHMQRTTRQ